MRSQLAGRFYRLQEYNLPAEGDTRPARSCPEAVVENRIPGVAHVYDAAGRRNGPRLHRVGGGLRSHPRVVLPGGTPFDEMMAGSSGHLAVAQEPDEEQALVSGWCRPPILLGRLHAEDIAGCSLELANLLVQPGNRLTLLDLRAARSWTNPTTRPAPPSNCQTCARSRPASKSGTWPCARTPPSPPTWRPRPKALPPTARPMARNPSKPSHPNPWCLHTLQQGRSARTAIPLALARGARRRYAHRRIACPRPARPV